MLHIPQGSSCWWQCRREFKGFRQLNELLLSWGQSGKVGHCFHTGLNASGGLVLRSPWLLPTSLVEIVSSWPFLEQVRMRGLLVELSPVTISVHQPQEVGWGAIFWGNLTSGNLGVHLQGWSIFYTALWWYLLVYLGLPCFCLARLVKRNFAIPVLVNSRLPQAGH